MADAMLILFVITKLLDHFVDKLHLDWLQGGRVMVQLMVLALAIVAFQQLKSSQESLDLKEDIQ